MKKMKRILAAGLMLLALAGCGASDNQAAEYPAMEPLDISKMELATVENGTAKYQYDADVWTTEGEVVNSLVLYARDTVGTEKPVAINVQIAGERKKALDEDLMNQVLEQLEKNASLTVEKCELRSFDEAAALVFLTSSPGFAYESYGVQALEYLLKPITAKKLFPLLSRLYLREQKPQEALTLKSNGTFIRVPFSELSYVEVSGKHLYFNMIDGQVREVVGVLREFEPLLLSRSEFMRIHRSYIVNMLQIEELSPAGLRTFSGRELPVSRLLYPQLQKDYMKLLFAQREE